MSDAKPRLLGQWAAIEPERCFIGEPGKCGVGQWGVRFAGSEIRHMLGWEPGIETFEADDYGLIQAAVQEAIEARGWEWSLNYVFDEGRKVYIGDVDCRNGAGAQTNGESAAEALLSAYVIALGKEAPR